MFHGKKKTVSWWWARRLYSPGKYFAGPDLPLVNDPENRGGAGRPLARPADTKFQPGRSGNPGGRPRIPDEVKQALLAATPDAVKTLVELSKTAKRDADRIRAAEIIVERVLGKSPQPLTGPDGEGPVQVAALVVLPAPLNDG